MAFQDYGLYPHMTVRQNIGFPLKVRGVEPADRDRRIEETADTLGIRALLDRKPRQNQRRRAPTGFPRTRPRGASRRCS